MDEIFKKIQTQRKLTSSSMKTYISQAKRLSKLNKGELNTINPKLKENLEAITITSRKNLITTLILILNAQDKKTEADKWIKLLRKYDDEYNAFLNMQTKTEKQAKNWITVDEINTVKKKLKTDARNALKETKKTRGEIQSIKEYFVLLFLTNHHTRLDLADVHLSLKDTSDKFNWLVKTGRKWEYHIYKFKTAKHVKDLPFKLKATSEENTYINKYIKVFDIQDQAPILVNGKGRKWTRTYLGGVVKKIFKKYLRTQKKV